MNTKQVTGNDLDNALLPYLVGIVFTLFGAWLLVDSCLDLGKAIEVASWERVEAELISIAIGSGGPTVSAIAYSYEYDGVRHVSHRGERFKTRLDSQAYVLRGIKKRGGPIDCYVDPNNPPDAVLFRTISPGGYALLVAFSTAFVCMGLGILALVTFILPHENRVRTLSNKHPDRPWNWVPEWRDKQIPEEVTGGNWGLVILSIIGLAGSSAGAIAISYADTERASVMAYGIGLSLSALVGVFGILGIIRSLMAGRSVLRLNENPIRRGQALEGTVRLGSGVFLEAVELVAKCQCCQATPTLNGYGVAKVHWKTETLIEPIRRGDHLEFSVDIPIDAATPEYDRIVDTLWWLEVRRSDEQHGRCVRFLIPVF